MNRAVPDVRVSGFEGLEAGLELPDPDDRHVLAAAIRAGAQTIVTWNVKDFPPGKVATFGITVRDPDDFVLGLMEMYSSVVPAIVVEQAGDLKSPPRTVGDVVVMLERNGLTRTAAELRLALGLAS